MINLVYILFVFIQFSYLFGGDQNTLIKEGYSYAEYARKGFFELVLVTMLNLSILVGSINFTDLKNKVSKNLMRILLCILIFCTSIILYSAHFRLSLYEEMYGYTHARLYAHIFMLFLFVTFIQALIKIWLDKMSLLKLSIITSLIFYVSANYINIDTQIAKNNINRYFKIGLIDIGYLKTLSYEAIPELKRLEKARHSFIANDIKAYLSFHKSKLNNNDFSWQSFNLSKANARRALK